MFRVLALVLCAGASACVGPPDTILGVEDGVAQDGTSALTAMQGFSWVAPDALAAMPKPGVRRPLEEDLRFLELEGIDILVSLTETPIPPEALDAHGIAAVHIPVRDFTAPTMAQLDEWIALVDDAHANDLRVGTHCLAGRGRTGTFMAAWFVTQGFTADDALAEIRRLRPGSVETLAQEQAVHDYARLLRRRALLSGRD